jgi:hypothetical protein
MNIISEIAQPASMAFRHFGNVAGGGVITAIIYAAFSLLSALVISFISSQGWLVTAVLLAVGVVLLLPLQPLLQNPALQPAFDNVVPALFGAMAYKYFRGNLKVAALPLLAMCILFIFVPSLSSATSFMILPAGGIAIAIAFMLHKKEAKAQ